MSNPDEKIEYLFPPRPWGLGAVLAAIIVVLGCLGLGVFLLAVAVGEENASAPPAFIASLVVVSIVTLAAAWFFGPAMHGGGPPALGLTRPISSHRTTWLMPVGVLAAVLLFNIAYVSIVEALGIDYLQPPDLAFDDFSPFALAATGIMVIIVGPFAEEVFFRGFIQSGLQNRWGAVAGVLLSAAIFSIFHVNLPVAIPIFVAGVLLGWLYLRTGSLWGCVWVHGAQNAIAFTAAIVL